ncbi:MAG: NAD-dependent epimerase/dehydratase family protein, partial [Jiangellaceae bacterium]
MADLVVTGAAGFIGGHIVELLAALGRTVVAVDREEPQEYLGRLPGVEYITAELTDHDERVVAALREAGAVVHLAACPGVRDVAPDIDVRRERDNVQAAAAVIAATPPTTPLVVASSSSVYGGSRWERPSQEDDPLNPRGGYAASKVATEQLCVRRRAQGGV